MNAAAPVEIKPLAIDLFCGLGGFSEGLLAEGFDVIGFDIERHEYGEHRYPAQLVLQDVLTIHGAQFREASLIVASPPCQEFSYMAMPWSKAKQLQREYETGVRDVKKLTALFDACFRIQREACEAAGRHIPMVVENVRGAQKWVGRARWAYGSFMLWGDVPALMPMTTKQRMKYPTSCAPRMWSEREVPRLNDGQSSIHRGEGTKNTGGSWFNIAHNTTSGKGRNPDGRKGAGMGWFNDAKREGKGETGYLSRSGSKSSARKAASALIAKIPFALSSHIAAVYR